MTPRNSVDGYRQYLLEKLPEPNLDEVASRLTFYRRLRNVWRLIEECFGDQQLCTARAARHGGLSPSHLNNLLRMQTGLTFKELLLRYRLYQAVEEMCRQNTGIAELAESVGFGSCRTFERQFRKVFGTTPKQTQIKVKSQMAIRQGSRSHDG